jgi:hypothetical protein
MLMCSQCTTVHSTAVHAAVAHAYVSHRAVISIGSFAATGPHIHPASVNQLLPLMAASQRSTHVYMCALGTCSCTAAGGM